jgi:hypothetical protein
MPAEELDIDLAPFRTLAGAAIGMTGMSATPRGMRKTRPRNRRS